MMKRWLCLMLAAVLAFGLMGCSGERFANPTAYWCSAFENLMLRTYDHTLPGDVESLKRASDDAKDRISAFNSLQSGSEVDAFLQNVLQIADLLLAEQEQNPAFSFFALPQWMQRSILQAWEILSTTALAESEEEYLNALSASAHLWLDSWVRGSSGYVLPVENPVLPQGW